MRQSRYELGVLMSLMTRLLFLTSRSKTQTTETSYFSLCFGNFGLFLGHEIAISWRFLIAPIPWLWQVRDLIDCLLEDAINICAHPYGNYVRRLRDRGDRDRWQSLAAVLGGFYRACGG